MMTSNLNDLLLAVSNAIDCVEMDVLGVTSNHSKRVAHISLRIAKELGLSHEECYDIVALSILHDNSLSEKLLHSSLQGNYFRKQRELENIKEHCIISEENIKEFPFLTDVTNITKYHHERFDGSGFFGIKGNDIPIMAQIISFADTLDFIFNLKENYAIKEENILQYLREQENKLVSSRILNAFYTLNNESNFRSDLKDENLDSALMREIPNIDKNLSYKEIAAITKVLSKIIDCKSKFTATHSLGLSIMTSEMAKYYNKGEEETLKLIIAADLHDIGKLAIPNSILDKPGKLTKEEFDIIKTHSQYTRTCLEPLRGFKDIIDWTSNHHEKLNGTGYPKGISAEKLDFNSRLLGCLDIYQALTEERPYREALSHEQSMKILYEMVNDNLIDSDITKDIDFVFGSKQKDGLPIK
jgi:HD-GYP domain-containing protein (c-di-GMP phosphodiesterase class II)